MGNVAGGLTQFVYEFGAGTSVWRYEDTGM